MKKITALLLAALPGFGVQAQEKDTLMQEVVISSSRPVLRQEADRIIYDLQADPQSKTSSLLDMMRRVPYLSVDGDERLRLNGSTSYRVFINGRPSGMVERNPEDVLRSIPASTIKSIEVITHPPARYDAEGLAGIINIITIKQVSNGYRASINVREKWPAGGPGAGISLAARQGKMELDLVAGGSYNNTPLSTGGLTRSTANTILEQNTSRRSDNKNGYTGAELSYEPDSLNLLTLQFNINGSCSAGVADQQSVLNNSSVVLQQYRLLNNNNSKGNGLDASINYQHNFSHTKRVLNISYRYMHYSNNDHAQLGISEAVNFNAPGYRQHNKEALGEHTLQADYTHPVNKLTIDGGLKTIFRNNNSVFRFEQPDTRTGVYEPDPLRSDQYHNNQDVFSAYNSYDYSSGHWQAKAGVRAEQTIINGDFATGTTKLKQQYLNILPSVMLSRKLGNDGSLAFSYAWRIQRPAIGQLNPFVDRSNPAFYQTGNPGLRPMTSSLAQLSYLKSGTATYNIAAGYMFFNQTINPIFYYDTANAATLSRYENRSQGHVVKLNIYFSYHIANRWNVTLNADLRRVFVYTPVGDSVLRNFGSMAYVDVSTGYRFNKGWRAGAEFTINTAAIPTPLVRNNGFIATAFSLAKDLCDNKLTLSAVVSNPFSRFRYSNNTITGYDFTQYSSEQIYFRRFNISFNYKFGQLKEEMRKNRKEISNDDIVR